MFANPPESPLTYLRAPNCTRRLLKCCFILNDVLWRGHNTLYRRSQRSSVEHMEPFIICQRVVGGGCGKVLSVESPKSSFPAVPSALRAQPALCLWKIKTNQGHSTVARREMLVYVMCIGGKMSLLPFIGHIFLGLHRTFINLFEIPV